jgi:aryl-alcohol dehydrogenase-like predicted oxidoreductase
MTLKTAPLGSSGLEITRVGFGAWAVGGGGWKFGWGASDDDDSIEAIRFAVDEGINWIDTAPVYGLGHSEEVVGRALQQIPQDERPYVFTKCGLVFDTSRPEDGPSNVLAPASIRRELEDSLRRLQVERIDLYQVHWPPEDGTPLEDYWAEMVALRDEGKVRAIGMSNHDVQALGQAEAIGHVDSLQPPFSLISREAAGDLLPWCRDNGTGTIIYSPMQSGLLTGAFTKERVAALPDDDWRRSHADFTDDLDKNLALAEALVPIAQRYDVTPAAVAVAWTLSWPGVTGAIVGARTKEQTSGWLPAADLVLSDDDLAELAAAIRRTGAGNGPVDPHAA